MHRSRPVATVLALLLPALAAATPAPDPVGELCPIRLEVAGVTLRLSEAYADDAERLAEIVRERMEALEGHWAALDALAENAPAVVAGIEASLGPAAEREAIDARVAALRESVTGFASEARPPRIELSLCPADRVKQAQRAGAALPGLAYEAAKDRGEVAVDLLSGEPLLLVLPVPPDQEPQSGLLAIFEGLRLGAQNVASLVLGAAAARGFADADAPLNPHARWLREGSVAVLGERAMARWLGAKAATELRELGRDAETETPNNSLNLAYWLIDSHEPDAMVPGEDELLVDRRRAATAEVRRLTDDHGPAILGEILAASRDFPPTAAGLAAAAEAVTGDDVAARLAAYGPDGGLDAGLARQRDRLASAERRGLPVAALRALLRLHELEAGLEKDTWVRIAITVGLAHGPAAADRAQLGLERSLTVEPAAEFRRHVCELALQIGRPDLAAAAADRLLAIDPNEAVAHRVREALAAGERRLGSTTAPQHQARAQPPRFRNPPHRGPPSAGPTVGA